jgi:ABC-2 type transport system permease protein
MQALRECRTYLRIWFEFARNSLVRELGFRANFILDVVSAMGWTAMNLGFYKIVFHHVQSIGSTTGWGEHEFYIFLGTTWIINSLVQAFFMSNAEEFSELIRTGGLDFAMLKPIDTQFLISFRKVSWSSLSNFVVGSTIGAYGLYCVATRSQPAWNLEWFSVPLYMFYIACGVIILYSLMITLAATSIWLGRNQSLYDFWFYITNFSRYPMEIYNRGWGIPLYYVFTFVMPVLVVVNVPARFLARPVVPHTTHDWWLAAFTIIATILSFVASRWIFTRALLSYRSASS